MRINIHSHLFWSYLVSGGATLIATLVMFISIRDCARWQSMEERVSRLESKLRVESQIKTVGMTSKSPVPLKAEWDPILASTFAAREHGSGKPILQIRLKHELDVSNGIASFDDLKAFIGKLRKQSPDAPRISLPDDSSAETEDDEFRTDVLDLHVVLRNYGGEKPHYVMNIDYDTPESPKAIDLALLETVVTNIEKQLAEKR